MRARSTGPEIKFKTNPQSNSAPFPGAPVAETRAMAIGVRSSPGLGMLGNAKLKTKSGLFVVGPGSPYGERMAIHSSSRASAAGGDFWNRAKSLASAPLGEGFGRGTTRGDISTGSVAMCNSMVEIRKPTGLGKRLLGLV
ncbi:uncharacterized protein VTP21DRAFT_344 [Calcarisporiella thermophila]|uniref:uncharacterized protein n=1 Tax=Calcarisporiella thermophila TaxID=911321 RepID=UPI00374296AB